MISDHIVIKVSFFFTKVLVDYLCHHHLRPANAKISLSHILTASRLSYATFSVE